MAQITSKYDAEVNLRVAREALAKGRSAGRPADEIKRLVKHVKDAETILAKINKALKK